MTQTLVKEYQLIDTYGLTETLNSILNGLIAFTLRERRIERHKEKPSQNRINELDALRLEITSLNNDSTNFDSLYRMEELIGKYGPVLKATQKKS